MEDCHETSVQTGAYPHYFSGDALKCLSLSLDNWGWNMRVLAAQKKLDYTSKD